MQDIPVQAIQPTKKQKPLVDIDQRSTSKLFKNQSRVTLKMRLWVKDYLKTGNATQSAKNVYKCSDMSANNIGSENLVKLDYPQFMELAGISDKLLMGKLKQGLYSKRIFSSHTEPDKTVPDMQTRHKYLETALKLKKRLTNEVAVNIDNRTLIMDAIQPVQVNTGVYSKSSASEATVVNGDDTV